MADPAITMKQTGAVSGESTSNLKRYANLTRELAVTQFRLKYTGSILGYLWSLLKPAMLFAISYAVFARLLKAGALTVNFPLQLLIGIVMWGFFSETISVAMVSIAGNGHIIRRAYFPRAILVIASSLTALFTFIINITLIIVVAAPLGRLDLGLHSLVVIPLVLEFYALMLGISLMLASFFVFYRDLGHIWEVSSQALFYGSAIVYPFVLATGDARTLIGINPVAQVIEDVRHALVSADPVRVPWTEAALGGWLAITPIAISIAFIVLGTLVFRRLSPRFAESL